MTNEPKSKGGRPRTGTVLTLPDGRFQPVVTLADGSRKRMKPLPLGTSRAMAEEKARYHTELAAKLGSKRAAPKGAPSAATEWWERYFAHRDAKGYAPIRWALNQHVTPVLGEKHPRDWNREDCERIVTELDKKIVSEGDDRISWKTGQNAWAFFTKACKVASSAKKATELRVRDDNPCAGVEGPDRGTRKRKQWLYPGEFAELMACDDVPVRWRRMYAILAYAYIRPSELKALDPADVDLDAGTIAVNESWDRARAKRKVPKTGAGVRRVPIEPELWPLLKALLDEHEGEGPLFPMPPPESWATTFRKHLERAKVGRAELFADSLTHKHITMYDLRASGITWRCLRRDHGPTIQRDAGHEKYDTTDGYIRAADAAGNVGTPFPALPPLLLSAEFRSEFRSARDERAKKGSNVASPTGFERVPKRAIGQEKSQIAEGTTGGPSVATGSKSATLSHRSEPTDRLIETADPVEAALADAISKAASAGRFEVLPSLVAELEARRKARHAPGVADLAAERAKRGGRS
ncbi:MAG TPA: hypothetical protein VFR23_26120 [Jiangellaceae bacterium]|nr:hypothetical protein [Jiangellaceae bacterium]